MRNDLPETCLATLPSTGELIVLKRGETGYFRSDWDTGNKAENKKLAEWHNHRCGITPAQVKAMQVGTMFGFDAPGADPQIYFDEARLIGSLSPGWNTVLCDPHSGIQEYVGGDLLQYQLAGELCCYIKPTVIPECIMGAHSDNIIFSDMVCGRPLIPVTVKWLENDACEMTLDSRAISHTEEVNAGYQIIAKVQVGPVEYALGELTSRKDAFVTWERTPANDGDGPPNYYWGHYFDSRDKAIQDFCGRAEEKFEMLSEQRKPSIKAQLAAKPVHSDQPAAKPKDREVR